MNIILMHMEQKEPSYVTTSGNWLNFYENYGYLLKKERHHRSL